MDREKLIEKAVNEFYQMAKGFPFTGLADPDQAKSFKHQAETLFLFFTDKELKSFLKNGKLQLQGTLGGYYDVDPFDLSGNIWWCDKKYARRGSICLHMRAQYPWHWTWQNALINVTSQIALLKSNEKMLLIKGFGYAGEHHPQMQEYKLLWRMEHRGQLELGAEIPEF